MCIRDRCSPDPRRSGCEIPRQRFPRGALSQGQRRSFCPANWIGHGQGMSEINETEDKTVRGGRKITLSVRRTVESGHVRQSFSHGRSKSVLVEKKKRRAVGATPAAQPVEEPKPKVATACLIYTS